MNKYVRAALIALCAVILVVSCVKLGGIISEYTAADSTYDSASQLAIIEAPDVSPSDIDPALTAPFMVDFEALKDTNNDVVGWIYSDGTVINYPILQGSNNTHYLEHMYDGSFNKAGSITMDCRNSVVFADTHTVIYGHNMKNGSMFASLKRYSEQAYYDEHPIMWIFTPEETYVLELVAGYITSASSETFDLALTPEKMTEHVSRAINRSTFVSGVAPESVNHLVTLVTCSYEYDDARYVLLGSLLTLDEMNARQQAQE